MWSTCISEQSLRQNDAAVSPAALQRVRSDESRPQRGGLRSPNHIKESIKIKPWAQGCHIMSRDVTFNAEILLHGHNINRTQFEQDQPPEYAFTNEHCAANYAVSTHKLRTQSCLSNQNLGSRILAMIP